MADSAPSLLESIKAEYSARFSAGPNVIARAPGRVNLIGEHTDYNDGFVLPMAIDRAIWMAIRPRGDRRVVLHLLDFGQVLDFSLDHFQKGKTSPAEYVKGVAWSLQEAGYTLHGFEGVMQGDVPIGAGLSSSAALEVVTARVFAALSGFEWDAPRMARLAQRAENQWVGMNCGIMDQMISAAGEAGHALLIDCRSLDTEAAPLPGGTTVVVMDTGVRRGLVDSAYNERRAQCETAAAFFGVPALRDVTLETFEERASGLDEVIRRRARHVITENRRTLQARDAMLADDAQTLGELMCASHVSLRDDLEVSCDELNTMVDLALGHPGCCGARMTGGGFGGCAVALVRDNAVDDFTAQVAPRYRQQTGLEPRLYICEAASGASILP
jgi:galactokinase